MNGKGDRPRGSQEQYAKGHEMIDWGEGCKVVIAGKEYKCSDVKFSLADTNTEESCVK